MNAAFPVFGLVGLLALLGFASPTIAAIYLAVKLNRRRAA